jgi:hypothetical protein
MAAHERKLRQLSVNDVAPHVRSEPETIAALESRQAGIAEELREQQVADWIQFLELDLDDAIAALGYSLHAPASSYAGDVRDRRKQAVAFVKEVRRILTSND